MIAEQLRAQGHAAVAAVEQGWEQLDDEPLLDAGRSERRALLTNNVPGFVAIVRRWAVQGQPHAGLAFTSDASLPRSRGTIGKYVQLLDDLLARGRVHRPDSLARRSGQAVITCTPAASNAATVRGSAPASVTSVSTRSIGQTRANA